MKEIITVGSNSRFAPNSKQFIETLFNGPNTANGFYKRFKKKIMFYDYALEPFACLCLHDYVPFFVSCRKEEKGIIYSFGLNSGDCARLGLTGLKNSQEIEIGERIEKETNK